MRIIYIALAAVVMIGCASCQQKGAFLPRVEYGEVRQLGYGFSVVDVMTENPPDFWEEYRHSQELRFRNIRIDEVDRVEISPSGQYALYGCGRRGSIIVFDAKDNKKLIAQERGTSPSVKQWSDDESSVTFEYYVSGNTKETITVKISELSPLPKE
jgi:hypothetical protein